MENLVEEGWILYCPHPTQNSNWYPGNLQIFGGTGRLRVAGLDKGRLKVSLNLKSHM